MKASDFTVSSTERKAAASGLVQTETTDAVNTGIVAASDRNAALSSSARKAVNAALKDTELEGTDSVYVSAKRGAKDARGVAHGVAHSARAVRNTVSHFRNGGTARELLNKKFNKQTVDDLAKRSRASVAKNAKSGVKAGVTGALKDSELDGLDTELRYAGKGAKAAVRSAKKAKRSAKEEMRKMQLRRNQAAAMKKAADTTSARAAGAVKTAAVGTAASGSGGGALAAGGFLLPLLGGVLVFIIFAALLSSILGGSSSTQSYSLSEVEIKVAQFFRDKGLDDIQIAGIMGNMKAESGMDPAKEQDGGGGRGICQWDGERKQRLFAYATLMQVDWTNLDLQLKFFWEEDEWKNDWSGSYTLGYFGYSNPSPPEGTHVSGSKQGFLAATDVADATAQFCYGWERAGFPRINERVKYAEEYYRALQGGLGASDYVSAALAIANDDSHGYSQANRTLNPDVDCSSLVYYALLNSGYSKDQIGDYPFATGTMDGILTRAGFARHNFTSVVDLQPGDILLRAGHTEIYIGGGKNVGAHSNYDGKPGDSSGDEVDVGNCGSNWTWVYRKG